MNAVSYCENVARSMYDYFDGTLPAPERAQFERHLAACHACCRSVDEIRSVRTLLTDTLENGIKPAFNERVGRRVEDARAESPVETEPREVRAPAASGWALRLAGAPWWGVSLALHVLAIALAGLISMAVELPKTDDSIIVITELQPLPPVKPEEERQNKDKPERSALESPHETPPTDPKSSTVSDVVVPPDILARAELGDHFETVNLDRPDTQSAFGNPDAHMFHSQSGNDEPAGGGGTGGSGLLDELIGIGGGHAGSPGSGGGWGGGHGTGVGLGNGAGRGSFGNRNGGGRKLMVKRHGGNPATENAVDMALDWLARHQEADGRWDCAKYNGGAHDTAMTGFALLAFLGAGHTEKVGKYKDNVLRAVAWLKSVQKPNGAIGKDSGYGYGICTMAMAEAAGMANIKETKEAAQKAVDYCTEIHQNGEGSEKQAWRYEPKSKTEDISVSGWFVMALKSAKVAGLSVNFASFDGAMKFLDKVQRQEAPDTGYGPVLSYGYAVGNLSICSRRSAIGNLCRQFMGWDKEKLEGSVQWFMNADGKVPGAAKNIDLYYWYYGTLCVFQQGGDLWKRWNEGLKAALLPTQCKDGDDKGSWTPDGYCANHWGRVGQTALSALCLEVYYRYAKLEQEK